MLESFNLDHIREPSLNDFEPSEESKDEKESFLLSITFLYLKILKNHISGECVN